MTAKRIGIMSTLFGCVLMILLCSVEVNMSLLIPVDTSLTVTFIDVFSSGSVLVGVVGVFNREVHA